jgi:hypothetical protein
MTIQVNRAYDNASPAILFDIVRGTTACSSTVFYGLLAWADLRAHESKDPLKSALEQAPPFDRSIDLPLHVRASR